MQTQIINAIKNFDIDALNVLLDNDRTYMDVTKAVFINKLAEKFEKAKKEGCQSFDDVFFGICESCNKGCEGMTFLSNSGYYLDLYIECEDEINVTDMYVCYKLSNIVELQKSHDLGFVFLKDEKAAFRVSSDYRLVKAEYNTLIKELPKIKPYIRLDDFIDWYDQFSFLRETIDRLDFFGCMDYKLYSDAWDVIYSLNGVTVLKERAEHAINALIDFQNAKSERDKLIWLFDNRKDQYHSNAFKFSSALENEVTFESRLISLTFDLTGYTYVLDYFTKLDNVNAQLMEKYKPLPEHFEQAENGSIEYSLESHLKLHGKHLDILQRYKC